MEYEYSFNVSNIKPYIDYCNKNSFKLINCNKQIRTIYRNNGLIGRITEDIYKDNTICSLDFKEDKINSYDLNIRKESKSIVFFDVLSCDNILTFLGFVKDNTLERIRSTFIKGNIRFEIDEYLLPSKSYVVAIEGNKEEVDFVYNNLKNLNDKYKIN